MRGQYDMALEYCDFAADSTLSIHQRVVKTCKAYWARHGVPPNFILVGQRAKENAHPAYKLKFGDGQSETVTVEISPFPKRENYMLAGIRIWKDT